MTRHTVRVLVTGGAGFIGSHVVDRLVNKGYSVRVIDNLSTGKLANIAGHLGGGRVDFVEGDIRDIELVRQSVQGVSVVFHLAAVTSVPFSVGNPKLTMDVNVGGTVNLLSAAVEEKVAKFVFVSSCAVYGEPKHLPVSESHQANPISPYAESKLKAENHCLSFHERQLLKAIVFRLFNVYGTRQGANEYSGVITRFFNYCKQGLPLTIYGDGSQTRDFVHVYDVSNTIANAVERNDAWGQIFNIGSGKATSIRELANSILRISGRPGGIAYAEPRGGDIKHSLGDISKAQQLLQYQPKYPLEDGLETIADEFLENAAD